MKIFLTGAIALAMLFTLASCGSGGGGDSANSGGGGGPSTPTEAYNSTRYYRVTTTWSPDTPTGVGMRTVGDKMLKLASARSVSRTVNSVVVWGETTDPSLTVSGSTQYHKVTGVISVKYIDDLYVTSWTSGTATVDHIGDTYRLNFDIPVPANSDNVTHVTFQSAYLSPVATGKHYSVTGWYLGLLKTGGGYDTYPDLIPKNPLIMNGTWTDGSTSTLMLTINRGNTGGTVTVFNNATGVQLAQVTNTTLVAGTPPDSSITVSLPFERTVGSTVKVIYSDPDLSDDVKLFTR